MKRALTLESLNVDRLKELPSEGRASGNGLGGRRTLSLSRDGHLGVNT
jgi:hypothetical protein